MTSSRNGTEVRWQRQITAAIAAGSDLESVLARITRAAVQLCRADMVAISLLCEGRGELEVVGVYGTSAPVLGERLPGAASLGGEVITSGRSARNRIKRVRSRSPR